MARVLMLGRLADAAGWREKSVRADTLTSLVAMLVADDPHLATALDARSAQVIVNDVLTRGDVAIGTQDEVAFMPPMSGG